MTDNIETLTDHLTELRSGLIDARARYTDGNELNAAAAALHTVNQFLQQCCKEDRLPADALIPLNELMSALADIEQGHQHPLLTPPKSKGGRPKNSMFFTQIMGTVSASIGFLMEGECNEEKAARKVARLMEKYDLPFPDGKAPTKWGKLTSMRDRLNQAGSDDPALDIQRTCLALFKAQSDKEPQEVIEIVFEGLSKKTT